MNVCSCFLAAIQVVIIVRPKANSEIHQPKVSGPNYFIGLLARMKTKMALVPFTLFKARP